MEPEEFEELIEQTSRLLRVAGVGTLADRERYTVRDPERVAPRALRPDRQLTEMLVAFERHLAILDRGTFQSALETVNDAIVDGELEDAVFVPTAQEGEGASFSFRNAPDLLDLRMRVKDLIKRLGEEGARPERDE